MPMTIETKSRDDESYKRAGGGIWTATETITPEIAKMYLLRNRDNRAISEPLVARYAAIMRKEQWKLNSQGIAFDTNGRLVTGQHRLMACIRANVPFTTRVDRGLDPDVATTMDAGRSWSGGDVLSAMKVKNANRTAAVVQWIYRFRATRVALNRSSTENETIQAFYLAHQEQIDHSVATTNKVIRMIAGGIAGALHFLFSEIDAVAADNFFHDLGSGLNLEQTDPVYLIREEFIKQRQSKRGLEHSEAAAKIIRAWNLRRANKRTKLVRGTVGNAPFPVIE